MAPTAPVSRYDGCSLTCEAQTTIWWSVCAFTIPLTVVLDLVRLALLHPVGGEFFSQEEVLDQLVVLAL